MCKTLSLSNVFYLFFQTGEILPLFIFSFKNNPIHHMYLAPAPHVCSEYLLHYT